MFVGEKLITYPSYDQCNASIKQAERSLRGRFQFSRLPLSKPVRRHDGLQCGLTGRFLRVVAKVWALRRRSHSSFHNHHRFPVQHHSSTQSCLSELMSPAMHTGFFKSHLPLWNDRHDICSINCKRSSFRSSALFVAGGIELYQAEEMAHRFHPTCMVQSPSIRQGHF